IEAVFLPTTSPPLGETSKKTPKGETREREQALKIPFSTACSGFHAAAAARLSLRRAGRLLILFDPQPPVPQKLGLPEPLRNPSRLHEQMIAQPVHIDDEIVVDLLFTLQPPAFALRTPAHRARLMD